jgi:ATP-dependent DNA helicase PIF1
MLLRNLDQKLGLCNETRLIITRMEKCVLEGKIISWSHIGDKVFILKLIQDIFLFKITLES